MHQFFAEPFQIQEKDIVITGQDVNHIKNVLRMHTGEKIIVVDKADGTEYYCAIKTMAEDKIVCSLLFGEKNNIELPARIYLFQGLPKGDKMDFIIQKAVELGCFEMIPVNCERCIVKLDAKKREDKRKRWQRISEAAAKQSRRRMIPKVHEVMEFSDALSYAEGMDVRCIPYELAKSMAETKKLFSSVKAGQEIAVFIGPEGGFEETEIDKAKKARVTPITLGRRILRTETAGLTVLSWLMYVLEQDGEDG